MYSTYCIQQTEDDQLLVSGPKYYKKSRRNGWRPTRLALVLVASLLCVACAAVFVTVPCVYVYILSPKQAEQVEPTCDSRCR